MLKKNISADVDFFVHSDSTQAPSDSFDMIIYTLSLHHIPTDKIMIDNLYHSSKLLKKKEQSLLLNRGEAEALSIKTLWGGLGDNNLEMKATNNAELWQLDSKFDISLWCRFSVYRWSRFCMLSNCQDQDMSAEKISELKYH